MKQVIFANWQCSTCFLSDMHACVLAFCMPKDKNQTRHFSSYTIGSFCYSVCMKPAIPPPKSKQWSQSKCYPTTTNSGSHFCGFFPHFSSTSELAPALVFLPPRHRASWLSRPSRWDGIVFWTRMPIPASWKHGRHETSGQLPPQKIIGSWNSLGHRFFSSEDTFSFVVALKH